MLSVNVEICMAHGRIQLFDPKALLGRMRLFSTAREIHFPRFEGVRSTYAEKQKIVIRLRNENGGSISL